jgi:hypothetical protein
MDYETAKNMANHKCSWRDRLDAVHILGQMDDPRAKDILARLAIHDPVQKVKEAALHEAQLKHIIYKGKPIYLGKKKKGNLVKDINKKLARVMHSFDKEFTIEEFKQKFRQMYPEAYDIYEGDKEKCFDEWLSHVIKCLPKKK